VDRGRARGRQGQRPGRQGSHRCGERILATLAARPADGAHAGCAIAMPMTSYD
jgi:hypothetical protein